MTDFNIGYIGTAIIALIFLLLGALVMYGTGEKFSPSGAVFAGQIIQLYTNTLGDCARPIILVAAFTTMFSTTLTCTDAFPRVMRRLTTTFVPSLERKGPKETLYWGWMLFVVAGALLLLTVFRGGLTVMVDVATTLSFLTAPILGWLNYRVVTGPSMPEGTVPPPWMRVLSWAGIAFGAALGILFIVWRLAV